jgi:heme-degrading monooxygenase HmoA
MTRTGQFRSTEARRSRTFQPNVFARMHILETTPDAHERGLELLDEILPWLRENPGFRGLVRLPALDRSKTVVITLWADEAAMAETAELGRGMGALAAEAAGSRRIGLEDYEVTFVDAEFTHDDLAT